MNGAGHDDGFVVAEKQPQIAEVTIENVSKEKRTIADIEPGTFFIFCGSLYLKLHHHRDHCGSEHLDDGDDPALSIVLPNYDMDPTRKVSSACVAMDGTGYYFPDIVEVDTVPLKVTVHVSTMGYKGAE